MQRKHIFKAISFVYNGETNYANQQTAADIVSDQTIFGANSKSNNH